MTYAIDDDHLPGSAPIQTSSSQMLLGSLLHISDEFFILIVVVCFGVNDGSELDVGGLSLAAVHVEAQERLKIAL